MYEVDSEGFIEQRRLPDQRHIGVTPLLYQRASLGIGLPPPLHDVGVYADQWDFPSIESALHALRSWNPDELAEPDGWHRHPSTGRYRIGGDASLEYVKGDGSVEDQVKRAVLVTQGQDRIIQEITEDSARIGSSFPQGTRCFHIFSESSTCTHDDRCRWLNRVYHYLDRSVVLAEYDIVTVKLATLKRRLTED